MTACLGDLERFLHETVLPPLVQVALIHYQFEATRREYYEGLQGITERGEWERWLTYFLNGVARQSEDALGRAERINRQLSAWRLEIACIAPRR